MLETITKSRIISSFALGLMIISNQVALASSKCTLNGQEVDCAELGNKVKSFLGWGIAGFLIIGIWTIVFSIMMIIHAFKHDIENKAMWIILMLLTGIVGACIYYFMVKRKFSNTSSFRAPIPMR